MKLEAPKNEDSKYVKFTEIGDSITGLFVSYEENVPGTFGPETKLTLKLRNGDEKIVPCKTDLKSKLGANKEKIVGKVLTITFVEKKPIPGKPQPMKVFDIDVQERGAKAAPSKPKAPPMTTETDEAEAEAMASQFDNEEPF